MDKQQFLPAQAPLAHYQVLYVLNQGDDKKIRSLLGNIRNALHDPRLKNKLHVELVAFGDGIELFRIANAYEELLLPLKEMGVVFLQCDNTLISRNIAKEELHSFVNYVPSANGEIILRQYEGWAVVHP